MKIFYKLILILAALSFIMDVNAQTFQKQSVPGLTTQQIYSANVKWADFDNDGYDDLYNSYSGDKIFKNNGNGTFTPIASSTLDGVYSFNALIFDFDNDGNLDIFSNYYGQSTLIRNTGSGFTNTGTSFSGYSSVAGDFDGDGDLDIITTNSGWGITKLLRNNGSGGFTELTSVGFDYTYTFELLVGDFNNDGHLDIVELNSGYNVLYLNDGSGVFTNAGYISWENYDTYYGNVIDFDNDGYLDIFLVNFQGCSLLKNNGDGTFTRIETSFFSNLQYNTSTARSTWGDYNNDGHPDLYLASYGYNHYRLIRNNGDGTFSEISNSGINSTTFTPTAANFVDFNEDGNLDMLYTGYGFPEYFRNTSSGNDWLSLSLRSSVSNSHAVGAKIEAHANGTIQYRTILTNLSDNYNAHFGFAQDNTSDGKIDKLVIHWPSGNVEEFDNFAVNRRLIIREGASTSAPSAPRSLKGKMIAPQKVELTWNSFAPFVTKFQINQTSSAGENRTYEVEDINARSFLFPDLVPGRSYSFRVRAVNANGNSAWSNRVDMTINTIEGPVVTFDPPNFTFDDYVTITYDASKSYPVGEMMDVDRVYMHSGYVKYGETGWTNVIGNWGLDDNTGLMTNLGDNRWAITINPRTYYNIPVNEPVEKLAMVFRDRYGIRVGKAEELRDIYSSNIDLKYCESGARETNGSTINGINIGGNQSYSHGEGCRTYTDRTENAFELNAGEEYSFNLSVGYCHTPFDAVFKVYVDWNNDGSYSEDELWVGADREVVNEVYYTNVLVPIHAPLGLETRMRVVLREANASFEEDFTNTHPCGDYEYGETADYTIRIVGTKKVQIASFSSASGFPGMDLTISGKNFGNDISQVAVQFGDINAEVKSVSNETLVVVVPNLESGDYIVYITVNDDTTESELSFRVLEDQEYCESYPLYDSYFRIDQLSFAQIDEVFNANECRRYTKLNNTLAEVTAGESYEFTIKPGDCTSSSNYYVQVRVYADWNQNGSFEDEGELILAQNGVSTLSSESPFSDEITIPEDLGELYTTIRVIATFDSVVDPCGVYEYGETLDFRVKVNARTLSPVVHSFYPVRGKHGAIVNIDGENFTTNPEEISVRFGEFEAEVTYTSAGFLNVKVPNITPGNYIIYVNVEGVEGFSEETFEVVDANAILYCDSYPLYEEDDNISQLEFANISEDFGNSCRDYSDRTDLVAEVIAGESYPIRIRPGICDNPYVYDNYIKVYIDWNGDGSFEGVGELVTHSNAKIETHTDFIGQIDVPANLNSGFRTRMRIISYYVDEETTLEEDFDLVGPCDYYAFGETIDLDIKIISNNFLISSFSPGEGYPGMEVMIEGEGFSVNPPANVVRFGDTEAEVLSSNENQLLVLIPAIGAGEYKIYVTVNGNTVESDNYFIVLEEITGGAPVISYFTPEQGAFHTLVTVHGSGFKGNHPEDKGLSNDFNNIDRFDGKGHYTLMHALGALEVTEYAKGLWDSFAYNFEGPLDLTNYPYLQIDIKATHNVVLRFDLEDSNNIWSNYSPQQFDIPGDGIFRTYKFDFTDRMEDLNRTPLDPSGIIALHAYINPGVTGFNGKVTFDNLRLGSHSPQADNLVVRVGNLEAGVISYTNNSIVIRNPVSVAGSYPISVNKNGEQAFSDANFTVTQEVRPAAPANLDGFAIAHDKIRLTWEYSGDNYSYFVVSRSPNGSNFEVIREVPKGTFEIIDTGLSDYSTYYYKVNAYGTTLVSNDSNIKGIYTPYNGPIVTTTPASVVNLDASLTIKFDAKASFPVGDMLFSTYVYMHSIIKYDDGTLSGRGEWENPAFDELMTWTGNYTWEKVITPSQYFNINPSKKVAEILVAFRDDEGRMGTYFSEDYRYTYIRITVVNDNTPPVISSVNAPQSTTEGESIVVSFNVSDAHSGVRSVWFRYKSSIQSHWEFDQELTHSSNGVYQFEIPGAMNYGHSGVDFSIIATDNAGNETGRDKTYRIARRYDDHGVYVPLEKSGSTQDAYEIIAIPLQLSNPSISNIFTGNYNKEEWRLFGYSTSSGNYVEYGNGLNNFELGKGYFFIQRSGIFNQPVSGMGNTAPSTYDAPFKITLNPGWNLIGNPYMVDLYWSDIQEANNYNPSIGEFKVFDGYFQNGYVLKVFRGGFVFANSTVELVFPLPNNPNQSGFRQGNEMYNQTRKLSEDEWRVNFTLSSGSYKYKMAGIGMSQDASLSKDVHDDMLIPRLSEYLDITFDHPEYFYRKFTKDVVPTSDSHVWEFKVESNLKEPVTTIEWEKPVIYSDFDLILFDISNQKIINMGAQTSYTFKSEVSKSFQVYYGNKDFVENALKPRMYGLNTAYPNPFNESTVIPFTLPQGTKNTKVSLKIYNSVGQEVMELMDKELNEGFYEATWNGTDARGNKVGAGIYICKMLVQAESGTKTFTAKIIKNY